MFNNVLLIDDDPKILADISEILTGSETEHYSIESVDTGDFEEGMKLLNTNYYDLVVLDLCKGKPSAESEKIGEDILKDIKSETFVPVIFFTGLSKYVENLVSDVIRVVNKGSGVDALEKEIEVLAKSGILPIRNQLYGLINESLRYFFWEFVHPKKDLIDKIKDEVSLGYLLLRRLSHSLSKERIKELLDDDKIVPGKAHPMEFYIYPNDEGEYECGEILEKEGKIFVILTPTCDFVKSKKRKRKAENVLLANSILLEETAEYQKYISSKDEKDIEKNRNILSNLIASRKGDRFFFLPQTPFIKNHVIDFQQKEMVKYEELATFSRVAKLDDPFAQSMISAFIRYYNRVGFPDIDTAFVLSKIDNSGSKES